MQELVKKAIEMAGFKSIPLLIADQEPELPLEVLAQLKESDVLLADITRGNAAAFFAVGLRMGIQAPVIVLAEEVENTRADEPGLLYVHKPQTLDQQTAALFVNELLYALTVSRQATTAHAPRQPHNNNSPAFEEDVLYRLSRLDKLVSFLTRFQFDIEKEETETDGLSANNEESLQYRQLRRLIILHMLEHGPTQVSTSNDEIIIRRKIILQHRFATNLSTLTWKRAFQYANQKMSFLGV